MNIETTSVQMVFNSTKTDEVICRASTDKESNIQTERYYVLISIVEKRHHDQGNLQKTALNLRTHSSED